MTRLRVGVIGLGEVAQVMHLPTLNRLQDRFEVVAAYDISPAVLARVADRWAIANRHATAEALVSDPAVDAVLVLSPDQHHQEHGSLALRAGRHLFVEKPACLTEAQLRALIGERDRAGKVAMVGYMRRFAPAVELARRELPGVGAISHVSLRDFFCEGPWYFSQFENVARPQGDIPAVASEASRDLRRRLLEEGAGSDKAERLLAYELLTGVASHSTSLMRDLLGMPKGVAAAHVSNSGNHLLAVFDYGEFCGTYEYLIDEIPRFDAGVEVFGKAGRLKLCFGTPYVRNLPMQLEVQTMVGSSSRTVTHGPFHKDPFEAELEVFHDCIVLGLPLVTSLEDSLCDLALFSSVMRGCSG